MKENRKRYYALNAIRWVKLTYIEAPKFTSNVRVNWTKLK